MGYHSPFLFSCGFDGLLPSKKKENKFLLGIPSALVRILYAIPSPLFSAAAELRLFTNNHHNFILC
jgi:hypothetical protein